MELSNSAINKIGNIIRTKDDNSPEYKQAIESLDIWRESHGKVMDEYYDKCNKLASKIDKKIIVTKRLKRLPTIIGKLDRFKTMRLSSMQDIAGVRIIVKDMAQLKKVEQQIEKWNESPKCIDHIFRQPKKSGYRSKHFIFKKDGKLVEVQLRTLTQHLWATSVETTDLFRGTSLKEKDDDSYWHDFFCQVSAIFAIAEMTPPIPGYEKLTLNDICKLLQKNIKKNSIDSQIAGFAMMRPIVEIEHTKNTYYIVIELNFKKREANVFEYAENMYNLAYKKYQELEKAKSLNRQVVLIGLNQIKKLHSAYPNYFVDLKTFISIVKFLLEESKKIEYNKTNE